MSISPLGQPRCCTAGHCLIFQICFASHFSNKSYSCFPFHDRLHSFYYSAFAAESSIQTNNLNFIWESDSRSSFSKTNVNKSRFKNNKTEIFYFLFSIQSTARQSLSLDYITRFRRCTQNIKSLRTPIDYSQLLLCAALRHCYVLSPIRIRRARHERMGEWFSARKRWHIHSDWIVHAVHASCRLFSSVFRSGTFLRSNQNITYFVNAMGQMRSWANDSESNQ